MKHFRTALVIIAITLLSLLTLPFIRTAHSQTKSTPTVSEPAKKLVAVYPADGYEFTEVMRGLHRPFDLAVDRQTDELYFVQKDGYYSGYTVKKIRNGKATAVCSGDRDPYGNYQFNKICIGYNHKLYVQDKTWINEEFYAWDLQKGRRVFTIWDDLDAGSGGTREYPYISDMAVSPINGQLYFYSWGDIYTVSKKDYKPVKWLEGGRETISISTLSADAKGNLYCVDRAPEKPNDIRIIAPDKSVKTIPCSEIKTELDKEVWLFFGGDNGNVFFDASTNRLITLGFILEGEDAKGESLGAHDGIFSIDLETKKATLVASIYGFRMADMIVDTSGNIYLAVIEDSDKDDWDTYNARILKIGPKK